MDFIIKRHYKDLQKICGRYNVTVEEIVSRLNTKEFKRPRVEVLCYLRKVHRYTYQRLWQAFDGRNHATILYLVNKSKPKKQFWGNLYTERKHKVNR